MKKFYIFAFVAMFFAACATDPTADVQPIDASETLTVSFEEDTRIQLQNGKTVWNEGDLVSVFYLSNANQKWQFQGKTGDRTGTLKRVMNVEATQEMSSTVVVYPYNESYYINPRTCNVRASLPATQHYLKDSYGLDGNIMISSSEYNQFSLKNVCGWLKLQITGNGEKVKSITLKGNNGEQVAGQIYINSADATATLASEMGVADDNENGVGGNLVFDETILTEVTLDCGDGVTLGSEATAFYIALPPQTFEKGITVEIADTSGYTMTQSTDKSLALERNTIQPMATFKFINPNTPTKPTPANNEIWYTATAKVEPYYPDEFGATITSNVWDSESGKGVITFNANVTKIGYYAFYECTKLKTITIPDSVTEIGVYAFRKCTSLTSVTIPDSVTAIGDDAFCECTSLTSITIPNSVTEIGEYAFDSCSSLISVTIPDSVTEIGEYAFCYCKSLTSVNIPNGVTTIGGRAFESCNSLTSVTIGNSVTEIGGIAFVNCTSLTAFYGKFASADNRCLIIDGVLRFSACNGLTEYTIPDSVTSIGEYAFYSCSSLISVNIPDSVTEIGYNAFKSCSSLKTVYCKPTTPPTGSSSMFSSNASGRRIFVPASDDDSIINAYKAKSGWSDYKSYIFEYDFSAE